MPASKVYATSDILRDPHYAAREQIVTIESETFGPLLQPGIVPALRDTPGRVGGRAPRLGEHNDEIYGGLLGLSESERRQLQADGII